MNKLSKLKKPLLMGPGPSCVSDSVYEAISKPTIGHLDPDFISLMDDIKKQLQHLFKTKKCGIKNYHLLTINTTKIFNYRG